MREVDDFFRELDGLWTSLPEERIRLPIIGSAALMLQVDYARGTKDSDILETAALTVDGGDQGPAAWTRR